MNELDHLEFHAESIRQRIREGETFTFGYPGSPDDDQTPEEEAAMLVSYNALCAEQARHEHENRDMYL